MRRDDVFAARLADGLLGTVPGGFVVAEWADPGGSPELIARLHVQSSVRVRCALSFSLRKRKSAGGRPSRVV
jgi:hypothetical protein